MGKLAYNAHCWRLLLFCIERLIMTAQLTQQFHAANFFPKLSEKISALESKTQHQHQHSTSHSRNVEMLGSNQDLKTGASDTFNAKTDFFGPQFFDPVATLIWTEPVFRNVIENWGFGARNLWQYTSKLGADRVRATIKHVQGLSGIRSRGAYLRKVLEKMEQTNGIR